MYTLNKVILTGFLTKDLTIKNLDSGNIQVTAKLATNDFWEDEQGIKHQVIDDHTLIFKYDLAQIALDRLYKGSLVHVDGKLKYRNWKNIENQQRWTSEIIVNYFNVIQSSITSVNEVENSLQKTLN